MLNKPKDKTTQAPDIGEFSEALADVIREPVPAHLESLAIQLDAAIKERRAQKQTA